MSNDLALAVSANWCQSMNRALEAVKCVPLAFGDYFKS